MEFKTFFIRFLVVCAIIAASCFVIQEYGYSIGQTINHATGVTFFSV